MVEGAALEMLFGGNLNVGSNPTLSVIIALYNFEPNSAYLEIVEVMVEWLKAWKI